MGFEARSLDHVIRLFDKLTEWTRTGVDRDVDVGAKGIAKQARRAIEQGQDADGKPLPPLTIDTLQGPMRRENDSRIRENSGSIPLNATGALAASISCKKAGDRTWEIGSDTPRGIMILASNAKPPASDSPAFLSKAFQSGKVKKGKLSKGMAKGHTGSP